MNVGKAIRTIRKSQKISQSDFGKSAGLSQTTLSQIESGLTNLHGKTMKKICETLGVSLAYVYLVSIEESDVPAHKRETFRTVFPLCKQLMLEIFTP